MDAKQIIMTYTAAPNMDDLLVLANEILDVAIPEELQEFCETLVLQMEDFPEDTVQRDLRVDDPYELLALYKSGAEISPGVEKKGANDDDVLILYRRPILDMWCESGEDLTVLLRHTIIEELAQNFEFTDDEIDEFTSRHYQGML